jgi:HD-GYP domain-containing protein (c-di-GMP phosphodiesterase class II)
VLALLHSESGPVYSRYTAFTNLAHCLYHSDELREGLHFAERALAEITPAFFKQDPHGALLLHRNCVKLYLAVKKLPDAKLHVEEVIRIAELVATPRASIAALTTQAAYEMACGDHDLGLTRLDQALVKARAVPATLRDTLVSVIRAEEKAGYPAHALVRLQELSDHIYQAAIDKIRRHVELVELTTAQASGTKHAFEQTKVRLISRLSPPAEPVEWKTLQRLAVGAAFRIDSTGWHGIRVGVLTQALALECGLSPIQALEFGLAAQLHDIGMASVPESVLMQPAALNNVERALVRKHVAAGAAILAGDQHPRMLVAGDMVKYHHARWDGEGFPSDVAGNSIPLSARLCAVADVYDSLVTDRPYRKARSMDESLVELRRAAGTQLDPDLVRSFEVVIRREAANEGIDPSVDAGLESFQKLINALTEDRGFL